MKVSNKFQQKHPNIMLITTDEERYPPFYENEEACQFRLKHSQVLQEMCAHGMEFKRHHTAATACAPSRTSLYTGQYPSLHGVSQTPGIGKSSFDQNTFWLKPNTVPTLGNYFRQAGYQTYYRGKWHLSYEDIDVPGTQTALMSNATDGTPFPHRVSLYEHANRLDRYGFDGWIGPEPHGAVQANDGTVRDPGFADQVCRTLDQLQAKAEAGDATPFLLVSSFVNPHDIVFSGLPWFPKFKQLQEAGKLPYVAPPPTADEALLTKPRCQKDYLLTYPRMYLPQQTDESYRQFYYFLMAEVHAHIARVYQRLKESPFFENTIVIFTSDHGDLLGAHGGLQQKWYNAYSEALHVPLIISNPKIFPEKQSTELYSSHIDLMPTILGLAGIDAEKIRHELTQTHSEAQALVGRDLSGLIYGTQTEQDAPIYFMTDDNVEVGMQMTNPITGFAYNAIVQPNHIETVITKLPAITGETVWKYSRYFDNPRFSVGQLGNPDNVTAARGIPDEFECYNLSADPLETENLASAICANPLPDKVRKALELVLAQQRKTKRLLPKTLNDQTQKEQVAQTVEAPIRKPLAFVLDEIVA